RAGLKPAPTCIPVVRNLTTLFAGSQRRSSTRMLIGPGPWWSAERRDVPIAKDVRRLVSVWRASEGRILGPLRPACGGTYGRSAPRPHEIANSEIETDEHHECDKPLVALGRTERDDKHARLLCSSSEARLG